MADPVNRRGTGSATGGPGGSASSTGGAADTDPARFVRQLPLFASAPDHLVEPALGTLTIVYRPAGQVLLEEDGTPAMHLWIVRKGAVELRRQGETILDLEAGDWFGMPSLLDQAPPTADALVTEDALLYRLDAASVRQLVDHPEVAAHVRGGLAERLRAAGRGTSDRLDALPVSALVQRPPVVVAATTAAADAARLMRDEQVTSVLVEDQVRGIVTDRDLRNRLVADGRPTSTPVGEVATRPLTCVPADATASDVREALMGSARHHAVVTSDGRPDAQLIGVVTTGDLLRHQAESAVHLVRSLERVRDGDGLARTTTRAARLAAHLLRAGAGPDTVTRALAAVADAATRAAIRLAVEELGTPQVPFAWLALGSQARREQGLATDQDHALIHAPASDTDRRALQAFAERVVDHLERAGYPRCPGGTMATRWHGDLDAWLRRFEGWLATSDQRALYEAAIFFDHRRVAGELDIDPLGQVVREARADQVLQARLAASAWTARPPIGWFHRLRADRSGRIDLKAGGLVPIVDLARVVSLAAGVSVPGTSARLDAARRELVLSPQDAATLQEAFRFLQGVRLRAHVTSSERGEAPHNRVDPAELSLLERRHLKEVLGEVADLQRAILTRLGADQSAG